MSLDFIESVPQTRWGLPATAKKDKYRGGPRFAAAAAATAATSLFMSAQTGCEATAADCLYSAVRAVFIYQANAEGFLLARLQCCLQAQQIQLRVNK